MWHGRVERKDNADCACSKSVMDGTAVVGRSKKT